MAESDATKKNSGVLWEAPYDFTPMFSANDHYGTRSYRQDISSSLPVPPHAALQQQAMDIHLGAVAGEHKFGKDKAEDLMMNAQRLNKDYVPFPSVAVVPVKSEALPPINPQGSPHNGNHRRALQGSVEKNHSAPPSASASHAKQNPQPISRQAAFDHGL